MQGRYVALEESKAICWYGYEEAQKVLGVRYRTTKKENGQTVYGTDNKVYKWKGPEWDHVRELERLLKRNLDGETQPDEPGIRTFNRTQIAPFPMEKVYDDVELSAAPPTVPATDNAAPDKAAEPGEGSAVSGITEGMVKV